MKPKEILLITSGTNDDKNSSWLVYKKFIEEIKLNYGDKIEVVCFTPNYSSKQSNLKEVLFRTFLRKKIISALFSRIIRNFNYYVVCYYSNKYTKSLIKIIDEKEIDILWVHSDLLSTKIIEKIRTYREIPYHYTIYDDPFTNRFYNNFKQKANDLFRKVLYNAKSLDTPTLFLSNYYKDNNYLNENCKICESLVGIFKISPEMPIIRKEVSKICLAGSIYGIDAFESFLHAISSHIENIEIHLMTNVPKIYLKYLEKHYPLIYKVVIFKDFVPEKDIINKLQEYDLLYLPMLFDPIHRFKTNSSFPSKTHNYLASGIPIIVHTPVDSSLDVFFKSKKIGCVINSLDKNEIEANFLEVLEEKQRKRLSQEILNVTSELTENKHLEQLYHVIISEKK